MKLVPAFLFLSLASPLPTFAEWPTYGADPQRTGWAKAEDAFTVANAKNIVLSWKIKLANENRELNALTAPIVLEGVITPKGFKEYVLVGGASDTLFAVAADSGKLLWSKQFESDKSKLPKNANWLCPSALNATPVVNHWDDKHLPSNSVFAIASDGKLHALSANDGEDRIPPMQFTPPYSKNWSLNIHDGILYTATSQGCGSTKSGVWQMDFNTPDRAVTYTPSTHTGGAGVWGRAGVAIGKDRIFASTGDGNYDVAQGNYSDTVLGVSLTDGKIMDYFTPSNRIYLTRKDLDMGNVTPVVFPYKGRELVAAGGKEGAIYLLDGANLGGADHRTPLFRSPLYANEEGNFYGRGFWGAFASWEDAKGDRWLFAPAHGPVSSQAPAFSMRNGEVKDGSIMAFKIEDKDGTPSLTPMWVSRNMSVPEPPAVSNGVVFAVSNGEFTGQAKDNGGLFSSQERIAMHPGHAVLYAFDAATGKELFSSGDIITGFTHFSGIAISSGHVFVTTNDDMLYAFGVESK